jgi:Cellulase (glycosyl hydrolase family 5)
MATKFARRWDLRQTPTNKFRQLASPLARFPMLLVCVFGAACWGAACLSAAELEWVRVAGDGRSFVLENSGKSFVPWGFNYDHDETKEARLIEDYWDQEWDKVAADFQEMKTLGANVVRIHLQFGKFMETADRPNAKIVAQLKRLVKLAEETGLYLDLTGLACYHKKDVPPWYDALEETARWEAQAKFWEAIAATCCESPAVFCYDLINEPVVPGGPGKRDDWLGPDLAGKHFVQYIALETKGRERAEIARQWVERLVKAVRKSDQRHLITVGLVPWSLDRPGLSSGFVPEKVAAPLDFLAVHIYPHHEKIAEELDTLRGFAIGKPVIIEEMFPLHCSPEELGQFIERSKAQQLAAGWIGFYWGKTPDEYRRSGTIIDTITLSWLELFQQRRAAVLGR